MKPLLFTILALLVGWGAMGCGDDDDAGTGTDTDADADTPGLFTKKFVAVSCFTRNLSCTSDIFFHL